MHHLRPDDPGCQPLDETAGSGKLADPVMSPPVAEERAKCRGRILRFRLRVLSDCNPPVPLFVPRRSPGHLVALFELCCSRLAHRDTRPAGPPLS